MGSKITLEEYRIKIGQPRIDDILQSLSYATFISGISIDNRGKVIRDSTREWDQEDNK